MTGWVAFAAFLLGFVPTALVAIRAYRELARLGAFLEQTGRKLDESASLLRGAHTVAEFWGEYDDISARDTAARIRDWIDEWEKEES